jgi:hypothetical protein
MAAAFQFGDPAPMLATRAGVFGERQNLIAVQAARRSIPTNFSACLTSCSPQRIAEGKGEPHHEGAYAGIQVKIIIGRRLKLF